MSYQIQGIFPTPVQQGNIGRPFTKEELDFVNHWGKEGNTYNNQGNITSLNKYVLDDPTLKDIREFAQKSIDNFVNNVYIPKKPVQLAITQSWLNYTKEGQYHHSHEHPNSFLSGVFYFDADFETDKIHFHKKGYQQIKLPTDNFQWYNSDSWFFQVKTGDIMLFPSSLTHNVETKKGENRRVSLAFNTFPVGYIGEEETLTALHTANPLRP